MPRSVCVSPGTEERRREDKQLESRSRQKWGTEKVAGLGQRSCSIRCFSGVSVLEQKLGGWLTGDLCAWGRVKR